MKDERKSYWLAGGFAVFMIAVIMSVYLSYFPVKSDYSNLTEYIRDFYSLGHSSKQSPEIEVKDFVTIGNNRYLLLDINGVLGSTVLFKI